MKNLQKAIEEIKAAFQSLRIKNNLPRVWQEELNRHGIDIDDWFEKELTQLITSREQEIREETIMKCMALVNTHTEHNGSYCDTGEDMDWACRSECVDMAEARLELYLAQQKENK